MCSRFMEVLWRVIYKSVRHIKNMGQGCFLRKLLFAFIFDFAKTNLVEVGGSSGVADLINNAGLKLFLYLSLGSQEAFSI